MPGAGAAVTSGSGSVPVRSSSISAAEVELLRTGTDPRPEVTAAPAPGIALRLEPDDYVGFLLVSDRAPAPGTLAVPAWRTIGALAGPALSLMGLLYLAAAAERMRSLGLF